MPWVSESKEEAETSSGKVSATLLSAGPVRVDHGFVTYSDAQEGQEESAQPLPTRAAQQGGMAGPSLGSMIGAEPDLLESIRLWH